jgi:SAM-dependent methyltransferase
LEDGRFDVAVSFNGIWRGCEDALAEARRVVRPGGLVGFSFWGSPRRLGLLPYFAALMEPSPAGPSWPPLQHARQDRFAEAMRAALRPLYTESLGVRIVSEFGWVIGTVPSA